MSDTDPYSGRTVWRYVDEARATEFGVVFKTAWRARATLPGDLISVDIRWSNGTTTVEISADYFHDYCHLWEPPPADPEQLEAWLDA